MLKLHLAHSLCLCIFFCPGCGDRAPKSPTQANAQSGSFQLKTMLLKQNGEYVRKSIVKFLTGGESLDGGLFDVDGYFYINSKPQCYLYLNKESFNDKMYMNGIYLSFESSDDERTALSSQMSGRPCRVLGRFYSKSEVDYGWSSGTIQVHNIYINE
jgi:hypothetical protein